VLASVYSVVIVRDRAFLPAVFGLHFILFEFCIVAGMLIFPGLEEMGGMLYLLLPLLGLMVVLAGAAARFVAGRLTKLRT